MIAVGFSCLYCKRLLCISTSQPLFFWFWSWSKLNSTNIFFKCICCLSAEWWGPSSRREFVNFNKLLEYICWAWVGQIIFLSFFINEWSLVLCRSQTYQSKEQITSWPNFFFSQFSRVQQQACRLTVELLCGRWITESLMNLVACCGSTVALPTFDWSSRSSKHSFKSSVGCAGILQRKYLH